MIQTDTLAVPNLVTDSLSDTLAAAPDTLATTPVDSCLCILDTIFTFLQRPAPALHRSLFTQHELMPHNTHEIALSHHGASGWYFAVILLSTFLLCIFIRNRKILLSDLFQALVEPHAIERFLRDANLTHTSELYSIAVLCLVPISLCIYYPFAPHNSIAVLDFLFYILALLGCYAAYFLRNSLFRLIGNAFGNSEAVDAYLASAYLFHLLYGVAACALAFFICYTGIHSMSFVITFFVVIGILFVLKLVKGLQLILTLSKTSKFYLFYYLCILEIVPFVILAKVLISM